MTEPVWLATLAGRDPSVPLALAALAQSADASGAVSFANLVTAYRDTYLRCCAESGTAANMELSGDEVRNNLSSSVLPRLETEGFIGTWYDGVVRASGPWWQDVVVDREGMRSRLIDRARDGMFRHTSVSAEHRAIVKSGSVLEGVGLTKSFKRRKVVDDVTVRVEQGEIVGLLGPNGAGKTTTFYLITGLNRPDAGRVSLDGKDLTESPMYQRARAGIGYLAQEPSVFRKMTVEENIIAILETMPLSREERKTRLEKMLDELGIKHLRKNRAYSLSGGERRRLEITRALVTDPKFMLLDEPFAGVDPIAVHDIQTIVAGLRHRGLGVLITDHNVEQTLDIVDRAYIMFEGKVQVSGSVRELVYDDRVAELYLGPTLTSRLRARLEAVA
ncbi:MAG TPA: LPS export ABC transporter ATP-binding protein [Gemmatimonadales bacterium]|jgi:lipopolysaccharide export system ATP-binding protein|nr:LPS export ABC transporter ATP-binding protein [Gemmatimonadales bacterium]